MKTLGIGMIGYGGIGRVHAMGYRSLPYHYGFPADTFPIVGVATARRATAEAAAAEIGCAFWTDDYHELLENPDIDVVDVTVPNLMHAEIVEAAAAAGKHVYCEKPLAMNVAEAQRMVAAAARAGIKTQMTFNFRFLPAVMRARQLVEDGFLGRVFSFRGRYYRSGYIDPQKPLTWRLQKEFSGGGALFDIGSHILDLLYYLLGDFSAVQATLETLIKERPIAAGSMQMAAVDVDDLALMHLRTASGVLGLVEVSRFGTGLANDLTFEIFGDKGSLRFCAQDPSWLEIYDARAPEKPLGGTRGFQRVETVNRYEGQKAPDWSMAPDFVRSHAECQYQFLRAVAEDRPPARPWQMACTFRQSWPPPNGPRTRVAGSASTTYWHLHRTGHAHAAPHRTLRVQTYLHSHRSRSRLHPLWSPATRD
ncbi:MAG: Gfo/Idh/MocA family oxidoreductase [Anaerolineales bacterium]|nr:Gfo/Idh/MocA family oxidoreductase [Anaerolineales bacterium]